MDCKGIEGFPLRLIITAVVLAITLPIMFGALSNYDKAKTESEIRSEIGNFINEVQQIYMSGPGNSRSIEFQCQSGAFINLEYVRMGDSLGGNYSSVISYKLSNNQESLIPVISPNVPMASSTNQTLELMSGSHTIIAECKITETDLNSDGHYPDCFVCLRLSA